MRHALRDRDVVDRLLDRVGNQVHPDGRGAVLADTVNTRNRLQLDGGVDERFAEEDVVGNHEVQACGVCFRVQQEAPCGGVRLELLDPVLVVNAAERDPVVVEGTAQEIQEFSVLAEDDGFGARVMTAEP